MESGVLGMYRLWQMESVHQAENAHSTLFFWSHPVLVWSGLVWYGLLFFTESSLICYSTGLGPFTPRIYLSPAPALQSPALLSSSPLHHTKPLCSTKSPPNYRIDSGG